MTIKDLARESGYSLGTVSRVLNNQPNVSEKARKTILAIAEERGFELNVSAQSLKQQRSTAVLVVVKGRANELFAAIVERLQTLFFNTTHPLIVDFIDENDNEVRRAVQRCRERKPMGVMFLGGNNQNFLQDFGRIEVPSVIVTNDASTLPFDNLSSVCTDDRKGAACAMEFLIKSGHRHIAILGGDRNVSDTSRLRYQGCQDAFLRAGMAPDSETFYHSGRYSYESGYEGMKQLLRQAPQTTAVFAMADVIAIGAMRALADADLSIPGQMSVVGYDGLRIGNYYAPKLTTISQQVDPLAQRSFDLLLECMEQGGKARHLTVPFALADRESVRRTAPAETK